MVLLRRLGLPLAIVGLAIAGWEVHEQNVELQVLSERIDRLGEAVAAQQTGRAGPPAFCHVAVPDAEAIGAVVAARVSSKLLASSPVAAKTGASAEQPEEKATEVAAPPPTDAQRQQLERAQQIVTGALAAGVIRKDEIGELRRLRQGAGDPKAFEALVGQLLRGYNQGRLRPEDPRFALP